MKAEALLWKRCRWDEAHVLSVCVWEKHRAAGESDGSLGSQTPVPLQSAVFCSLCSAVREGFMRKGWMRLNGRRCFWSWQLCIHPLYTNNSQTWTSNATSSFSKLFWRHSHKNAAEERRHVIPCRNIYVQLVHTETQKHNILLIPWCLCVQIHTHRTQQGYNS